MRLRALLCLLVAMLGCAQERARAPIETGMRYKLLLVAGGPRDLLPEALLRLAPVTDSATYWLEADSIRGDSIFGKFGGENPHFWVPMWGDPRQRHHFVAVPTDSGWQFDMAVGVVDAGLDLRVTSQVAPIRGVWSNRSEFPRGGRFEIRAPGA